MSRIVALGNQASSRLVSTSSHTQLLGQGAREPPDGLTARGLTQASQPTSLHARRRAAAWLLAQASWRRDIGRWRDLQGARQRASCLTGCRGRQEA